MGSSPRTVGNVWRDRGIGRKKVGALYTQLSGPGKARACPQPAAPEGADVPDTGSSASGRVKKLSSWRCFTTAKQVP